MQFRHTRFRIRQCKLTTRYASEEGSRLDLPRQQSRERSAQDIDGLKRSKPELYPLLGPLPEPVASFFDTVSGDGFPPDLPKAQPWRDILDGPHHSSPDGKLMIACPKMCLYGRSSI
jgi:hypothetical protein